MYIIHIISLIPQMRIVYIISDCASVRTFEVDKIKFFIINGEGSWMS